MPTSKQSFIDRLFADEGLGLVKYLTSRFRDRADAEEVAQEAWVRMYKLDNPEELDNAKAFLFQTASNLSIDRLRRKTLEHRHAIEVDPEATLVTVEDRIEAQQALDTIEEALLELPYKARQAFVMHRHNGLSYPQIADQLGVSTSMGEKYVIQALKHFRNKLEHNKSEG